MTEDLRQIAQYALADIRTLMPEIVANESASRKARDTETNLLSALADPETSWSQVLSMVALSFEAIAGLLSETDQRTSPSLRAASRIRTALHLK